MKRCSTCKESKELICFNKNNSRSDGFCHQCKECTAEQNRKYRQAKPEKVADYQRKYYQANAEKVAECSRKWHQANPEKIAKKNRKYEQKQKQEQAANLFFQMAHFASEITKTTITP